jgi:chromosome segregation ATPase
LRLDNNAQLQASRHSAEVLQQQLDRQRMIAQREVGAAKDDAEKKVQDLEQRVAAEQTKQAELIGQVKQTAETTSSKLTDVSTDVGTVKSDLSNTKSELETTISNLKRVNGDLDSHASLIATNGKELAALRALGERNYVEFTLPKAKHAQRVGDISLRLEKLDLKKNRFTVEVTADDQVTEKKDRTLNEPIQFYTSKAKQPYEIVVNKVSKDTIVGYLATPKVQNGR